MKIQFIVYTDSEENPVIQIATSDEIAQRMQQEAEGEKKSRTKVSVVPISELSSEAEAEQVEFLLRVAAVLPGDWYGPIETLLCLGARLSLKR